MYICDETSQTNLREYMKREKERERKVADIRCGW